MSRPSTPGGSFAGGVVSPSKGAQPLATIDFVRSVGDEVYANKAATAAAIASKADASAISSLQTTISGKADASTVTALQSTVNAKADASTVTALQSTVSGKADSSTVSALQSTVNNKADTSTVNTALAAKADVSTVTALQSTVSGKADTSTVNTALAAKADISAVNTALALKADTSAVNTGLSAKADASALSSKADTTTVTALQTAVSNKADASALAAKADATVTIGGVTKTIAEWLAELKGGTVTVALNALTLSASSVLETAAAGAIVGTVVGKTANSALILTNDAGGRFALDGLNIVRGPTALSYASATSHQITIRETLNGATGSPRDTTLTINVTQAAAETFTSPTSITAGIQNYNLVGVRQPYSARVYSPSGRIRFELRPGEGASWDSGVDQQRAQFDGGAGPIWPASMTTDTIYTYFDFTLEGNVSPAEWMLIWEWHHTASSGSPPLAYIFEEPRGFPNRLYAVRRNTTNFGVDPITQTNTTLIDQVVVGRKYSMKEEVRFGSNGFWRVWVDGVQKVNYSGPTGYPGLQNYPEFGIYTNKYSNVNANKTHSLWFDKRPAPSYTDNGGSSSGGSSTPTALAYTNSLDTAMSSQELTNINNLFTSLSNAGILSIVQPGHGLWLLCTTTLDGALTNCLYPTASRAVRVGAVTHTPKSGMQSDGTTGYINTGSKVNYTDKTFAHRVVVHESEAAEDAAQIGNLDYTMANAVFAGYTMAGHNTASASYDAPGASAPVNMITRRNSSTSVGVYLNGTLSRTATTTEDGTQNLDFIICGSGTQYTNARIGFAAKLPLLTDAQLTAFNTAMNTFCTAQAALP